MTFRQLRQLFVNSFQHWNEDGAARLAAALAFYAILALAPLLLLGVAVLSQFLDSGTIREHLLHEARSQLGSGAGDMVTKMIEGASRPLASATAAVISIALALLGASGLFDQIRIAMDGIWKIRKREGNVIKTFLLQKLLSVLMSLVFVTLILASMGIDAAIAFFREQSGTHGWRLISLLATVIFLTGVFAIAFKSLPHKKAAWSDVWLPATITALGFGLSKYLLSLYFGYGRVGAAYGPAGALVVLLIWLYYSAQIFFFGAELTCEYAHSFGSFSDRGRRE